MTTILDSSVYCSLSRPVASCSATKPSASSIGPPPDIPTMMLMSSPFEGNQLEEDVRRLLLGDATRIDLKCFDRARPAAGKQEERGKNGVLRFLIRGSIGYDGRTVLFMS